MKELSLIIGKVAVVVLLAMMPIVVSAVEYKNSYRPAGISTHRAAGIQVAVPTAVFHSTSTLPGSGSAYSATPMLGADGTAMLEGGSCGPAQAPGGPRRIGNPDEEDEDDTENGTPIGDAVPTLLLLALAYLILRAKSRRASKA